MSELACRELAWDDSFMLSEEMDYSDAEAFFSSSKQIPSPPKSYSKRSSLVSDLRAGVRWAVENEFEDLVAPTSAASEAAETFIYSLPEGCLNTRLEISSSGEINFFYRVHRDLFQVLIDSEGLASYYGTVNNHEISGSDVPPESIPYMKILSFVDKNK